MTPNPDRPRTMPVVDVSHDGRQFIAHLPGKDIAGLDEADVRRKVYGYVGTAVSLRFPERVTLR